MVFFLALSKLAFTYLFCWPLASHISEIFSVIYSSKQVGTRNKLIDVIQENFSIENPKIFSILRKVKDIVSYVPPISILLYYAMTDHDRFNEFSTYICGIKLLRCLFFLSTTIPACNRESYRKTRLEKNFTGGCNDLIFSGHVSHFYASLLYLQHYHYFPIPPFLPSIFLGFIIVILKHHYTIDILVVFPVVWCWYSYYIV